MKKYSFIFCILLFIGTFCHESEFDLNEAKSIQIITPINHSFYLELDDLKQILEVDTIKDRHVVVVSIAGAYRKGKSFLLNFFVRFLHAQYKKHDASDWLLENENVGNLSGFKWRGGRKPETTGIWMWSEVFTYDYENGEKVAILLLDTQGIFDSRSSLQDCTTIFALSMMLSSVQCYNVMQNIQENDLQHLDLFTEYGRIAQNQTNEKPFQYLLFIIRDWPFAYENDYGWGQKVIDELMTSNDEQTIEMLELRQRINSSFDEIGAFLLPYPGKTVAQGKHFNGDLKQVDSIFLKYVKELVPSIFAPDNLVMKRVNGEKIRARDLVQYIQAYLSIFNGKLLPEPKTVLMATAEASNLILFNDVISLYVESMQQALKYIENYLSETELLELHETSKNQSILQFAEKRKLGSEELILSFQRRIENTTEEKFLTFKEINDEKRRISMEKAKLHNEKISNDLKMNFVSTMLRGIESMETLEFELLNKLHAEAKQMALDKFELNKMGEISITTEFQTKLEKYLKDYLLTTIQMLNFNNKSVNFYSKSMQNLLINVTTYASENYLFKIHQECKKEAEAQFQNWSYFADDDLRSSFQRKVENEINRNFKLFSNENEVKRQDYTTKAMQYDKLLVHTIEEELKQNAYEEVDSSDSYLSETDLWYLNQKTKLSGLEQYDSMKMGFGDISKHYRTQLENYFNEFSHLLDVYNSNKKSSYQKKKIFKTGGFASGGAVAGGVIAGPPGALLGGLIGGLLGLFA